MLSHRCTSSSAAAALTAFVLALSGLSVWPVYAQGSRPNIVVVIVDDMRSDEFGAAGHPFVETPNIDRIAREGVRFVNAFAALPLCSPNRASFLTGLYPHTHGFIDNRERGPASHLLKTFPQRLQRAGYETAFIGKWHMGNDDTPRPGFDYWVSFRGQGTLLRPELNEDGKRQRVQGYLTDILTDRALRFLERPRTKPFMLYLAHRALLPNEVDPLGFIPAERHAGKYAETAITRRPSAGVSPRDKPALWRQIDDLPMLGRATMKSDGDIRARLEMLLAVDEGLGKIFEALSRTRQLENTVIVFTSDHGTFHGEHGLDMERRFAYEESARIPFLVRYPGAIKLPSTRDELVVSVDLAPTLLELAGVSSDEKFHGRSLVPLLTRRDAPWRTAVLIEYFSDRAYPRTRNMGYQAVRTAKSKYIHYTSLPGADELYDLEADPYELNNLLFYEPTTGYYVPSPANGARLREMRNELVKLLTETDNPATEAMKDVRSPR